MTIPDITIAIDGYSSTGKSTFAKALAKELGYIYLDSGAMYRAVTLSAIENGLVSGPGDVDEEGLRNVLKTLDVHFETDPDGRSLTYMGERCVESEIRTLEVSSYVSPVSAIAFVRNYVDSRLHEIGSRGRVVSDGRDIGTTVFPKAELKLFMTASEEVRTRRRYEELLSKGQNPDLEEVRRNLRERDYMDSHREVSPLRRAEDAVDLDNSDMTLSEELDWAMGLIRSRYDV